MQRKSSSSVNSSRASGFFRSWGAVVNVLRFVIALQCFGIAGRFLFSAMESESHIFEYLLFEQGVAENVAQWIDDIGASGCLVAAVIFLLNALIAVQRSSSGGGLGVAGMRWIEMFAALFVLAWAVANAVSQSLRGGLYSELALAEVAVHIVCPLVLILFLCSSGAAVTRTSAVAKWLLTLSVSVTFAVHGYKAIMLYGAFVDLILLSDFRMLQFEWDQETVERMLWVIGWIDVLLAIALLFTRWRFVAVYMLVWGAITAFSRMTAMGWPALPETIVRAANWGAPLVLLLIWQWESALLKRDGGVELSE